MRTIEEPIVVDGVEYNFEDMTDEQKKHALFYVDAVADLEAQLAIHPLHVEKSEIIIAAFLATLKQLIDDHI